MSRQLLLNQFFSAGIKTNPDNIKINTLDPEVCSNEESTPHSETRTENAVSYEPLNQNFDGASMNSEYERLREENMRRNAEFLKTLGLNSLKPITETQQTTTKSVKRKRRLEAPACIQLRRSVRNTNTPKLPFSPSSAQCGVDDESDTQSEKHEEMYIDAPGVFKYTVSPATAHVNHKGVESCMYRLCGEPLICSELEATYSLEYHCRNGLLLAAGKRK